MAEGNPYIDSKHRASMNKCDMSLYCTNIDVYFDNKDVYFQKCFDRRDMHNDNGKQQDFGKLALRKWAVFTKNPVGSQNSISHSAQAGRNQHFSTTETVLGFVILSVTGCSWLLYWLSLKSSVYKIRIVDVFLKSFFILKKQRILKSHDDDVYRMLLLCQHKRRVAERLSYFCSLTELFTTNKLAMYCTDIFYPMAVCDETTLLNNIEKNKTRRQNISVQVLFLWNFSELFSTKMSI